MANGNFGGGNGTVASPYLVEDVYDLDAVRNYLGDTSVHFKQVANIDLSSWGNWFPIQNGSSILSENVFMGVYDGGGYKISNMTCQHDRNYVGLFGYIAGATIKNVFVENCNVSGEDDIGSLVGGASSDSNTILNCYSSGNVSSSSSAGGLIGSCNNYTIISNCYFSGNVSGANWIGGLIGSSASAKISNCYSSGSVSGTGRVGGLIGMGSGIISNCYSSSSVSGSSSVGGLVGAGSGAIISNCYALNPFIARTPDSTNSNFSDISYNATIENCFSLDTLEFRQL